MASTVEIGIDHYFTKGKSAAPKWAIAVSYPTSVSGIIVFSKTP